MAARQTEACERGQVPALQKADQVAAAGMQGGMSAPFRLVTHWIKEGRFLLFYEQGHAKLGSSTRLHHTVCTPF